MDLWIRYEVEVRPEAPELKKALGEYATWIQFYCGRDLSYVVDKLRPELPFGIRIRAVNAKGQSEWVERHTRTFQEPINCGGTVGRRCRLNTSG